MKNINKLMKGVEKNQVLLAVLFVVYILFDIETPDVLANYIDTMSGNIVVCLLALAVFVNTNAVIGMLAIVVAYMLIERSKHTTGSVAIDQYIPSEKQRSDEFIKYNEDIREKANETIEVELVKKMQARSTHVDLPEKKYQSITGDTHSAEEY